MKIPWTPHRGPQQLFHASPAYELLYGGAAGGGKSDSLLMEALRWAHVPGYAAVILRRTYPQLAQAGGLIPRSREVLHGRASWNEERKTWTFPSGATLQFGHMQYENDKYNYQGAAFAYIAFDELTQFSEDQYLYLFSRARTTIQQADGQPLPVRIRATTNPGGAGHEWVRQRWGAWLGEPSAAVSGEIRCYVLADGADRETTLDDEQGLSRQFIAASVVDNPTLLRNDPGYIQRLEAMPLIERERLLRGNWAIMPAGNVFRREWFNLIEQAPKGLRWARYWDLAASTKTSADYTASVAAALAPDGTLYLRDVIRGRWEWPDQERIMVQTMLAEGADTLQGIEKALHGIAAVQALLRRPELAGMSIRGIDVDGDKLARALPLSARAEQGKVALVRGEWSMAFIDELCAFSGDGATHDDQVDAASGALQMLAAGRSRKLISW